MKATIRDVLPVVALIAIFILVGTLETHFGTAFQ